MATTINRKSQKKNIEKNSEFLLEDTIGSNAEEKDNRMTAKSVSDEPSIPKEILEMADDDPRILEMMENNLKRWKKKYPNVTREEIDRKLDEMLESEKELRKKSKY